VPECVCGRESVLDPARGAYSAHPGPLAGIRERVKYRGRERFINIVAYNNVGFQRNGNGKRKKEREREGDGKGREMNGRGGKGMCRCKKIPLKALYFYPRAI